MVNTRDPSRFCSGTVPFLYFCPGKFLTSNGTPYCLVFYVLSRFCPDFRISKKYRILNVTHQWSSRCDAQQLVST